MGRKGLEGLKGLDFSTVQGQSWIQKQKDAGIINDKWAPSDIQQLYRNQQFIDKYGLDKFESLINDPLLRDQIYETDITNEAFYNNFNPFPDEESAKKGIYDPNKGMGTDFFKLNNILSTKAKQQLLNSDWLTNSEMDEKIRNIKEVNKATTLLNISAAGNSSDAMAHMESERMGNDVEEYTLRSQNEKLLDKIYSEDLKNTTSFFKSDVDKAYNEIIQNNSEEEINREFSKAINPDNGDPAYIYSAYFNASGESSEEETKDFTIQDKAKFIAKKAVYDSYIGADAGYDALNNEGKEYLEEHQGKIKYTALLLKDTAISAASYASDKWNSARRLTLLGRDADVYMDNDGKVVPTKDVHNDIYITEDGKKIPVHKETLSLLALDDMGKDGNGEDRGWFNNSQFWNRAEQYGTMDEEEQSKYEKLGYSPYKVVYRPGDDSDLFYESFKMVSFGVIDRLSPLLTMGITGVGFKTLDLASKLTGKLSTATNILGKTMVTTGKVLDKAQPVIGATAIGNAYGRGVYGESSALNMLKLEQSVQEHAQQAVYDKYNNDSKYKAQIDSEVDKMTEEAMSKQIEENDGNSIYKNPKLTKETLKNQIYQDVFNREVENWSNNYKNTEEYGKAMAEMLESATDASLITAITTGAKYTVINYGWRSFLFKNSKELSESKVDPITRNVTETANKSGKKRLSFNSWINSISDQRKVLAKTALTGFWNGAWTNYTDELQSEGGRKINEDRVNLFLDGMYDGDAASTEYGIMDGLHSYMGGMARANFKESTWNAGLVGGLGSTTNFMPTISNILSIKMSGKSFRKTWKESSFGEKVNLLFTNGVLSEYYAKKNAAKSIAAKVAIVNQIIDDYNEFEDIYDITALDLADMDSNNPEDSKALRFIKSIQVLNLLRKLGNDPTLNSISRKSSIIEKVMSYVEKLSDPTILSSEEIANFLSQYYAQNKDVVRSEENDAKALQKMQENAKQLKQASTLYSDIIDKIDAVERKKGIKIDKRIKDKLIYRLAFKDFIDSRTKETEKEISGRESPTEESSEDAESIMASKGNEVAQQDYVNSLKIMIDDISKTLEKAHSETEKAKKVLDEFDKTQQEHKKRGATTTEDLKKIANDRRGLLNAYNAAKRQEQYLKDLKRRVTSDYTSSVRYGVNEDGSTNSSIIEAATTKRVLSADEILHLDPISRARMLDEKNLNKYSKEQQAEIDKLKETLKAKDPTLLNKVQDIARLQSQRDANEKAYNRIIEDPEAASFQLELNNTKQEAINTNIWLEEVTKEIKKSWDKYSQENLDKGLKEEEILESLYKQLKTLNPIIINFMNNPLVQDQLGLHNMKESIQRAKEWGNLLEDVDNVVSSMNIEGKQLNLFMDNLHNIIDNLDSKAEVLDEIGKIINSEGVSSGNKASFIELLNNLEQVWNQRSSTSKLTKEERETKLQELREKEKKEEEIRKKAEEEARKKEEEKKEKEEKEKKEEDKEKDKDKDNISEEDLKDSKEDNLTEEEIKEAFEKGEEVDFESPDIEDQVDKDATNNSTTTIIEVDNEDTTDQGNNLPQNDNTLLGNTMYSYESDPLYEDGEQVKRRGKSSDDKMSRYFDWLETAGIKMQEIIDNELNSIMKLNPKVYPMFVKYEKNSTNDDAMVDFVLLTVEYTPEMAKLHNSDYGGVITSNEKQYLVIGTLGFSRGNVVQGNMVREILKSGQKSWFDSHPSERFFVDTRKHTLIQTINSGRLVRKLANDSEIKIRSISELLADKERNPKGLTFRDLKWGIQQEGKMVVVNVSERNIVYPPSDAPSNSGSVFLLIESSNGNYLPVYINPTHLNDLKDGKLKNEINNLINELTSTDYSRRLVAIKSLVQLLYLSKNGNNILIGDAKHPNNISIVQNGKITRTFDLTTERNKFLEAITEMNPRINITVSALSNVNTLESLDEAGALTTDIALLGTSNASYNVCAIDADGNPIISEAPKNEAPTLEANSDLSKAQKKQNSERIGNITYRKDSNGVWHTDTGKVVTDPRLIEQLNLRNLIRTRNLTPVKTVGTDEVFIINNDKNNPLVVIRKKGSYIVEMSKEGAIKTIEEHNKKVAEEERKRKAQEVAEKEKANDEAAANLTEKEKLDAFNKGEDVDFDDNSNETDTNDSTDKEFSTPEKTPQQLNAEKQAEKLLSDSADLEISKSGTTYIEISTGELLPRVTSVISADIKGKPFPKDSPWTLPSTTLGTGMHNFIEDLLFNRAGNPENYVDRYPNATNEEFKKIAKEVDKLKEYIKAKGLTIVGTEIKVSGEIEVFDPSSKEKKIMRVAGSIDLLLQNKDGKFVIFDFKTIRSTPREDTKTKWALQTSLYNQILQEKYGMITLNPEIVPIHLSDTESWNGKYPTPKGAVDSNGRDMGGSAVYTTKGENGEQLVLNGKDYKAASASIESNVSITPISLHIEFSKLPEEYQKLVKVIPEESKSKGKTPPSKVQSEPIKTKEDINSTGTKSLASLQEDKKLTTALSILRSKKYGKTVMALLRSKFPDMPSKVAQLDAFLQSKDIPITNISDVEDWIKLIKECK